MSPANVLAPITGKTFQRKRQSPRNPTVATIVANQSMLDHTGEGTSNRPSSSVVLT
jgi:predicted HTH transcriptional regulator